MEKSSNREKKIIETSIIGILANLLLVGFKAAIGFISGSLAIVLDAVNNLSDALSSLITIIGTKLAAKAPDKDHPFGHGRIEYVTSIAIAVLIIVAGVLAFIESINKIITPVEASYTWVSFVILGAAILVKLFLSYFFRMRGKKYDSESLKGAGADAFFDAIISTSTVIAALISMFAGYNIEGYFGAAISLFIFYSGGKILYESFSSLIGKRTDPALAKAIKEMIASHDDVLGAYDLALHQYGPNRIIGSVHIEVDEEMKAKRIDQLSRHLTMDAYNDFGIILTVGIYASNEGDGFKPIKEELLKIVKDYPSILQVHGFFGDQTLKVVSFDLVFDFEEHNAENIKTEIVNKMKEKYPEFEFVSVVDNDSKD